MTFQDALIRVATDRSLKGEQLRVLMYLMGRLDYENWIHVPQSVICEALEMDPSNVSRAIAALTAKGLLTKGPKLGRVTTLRLSLNLGWKGRVRNLQAARKPSHLSVVKHSTPPAGGKPS